MEVGKIASGLVLVGVVGVFGACNSGQVFGESPATSVEPPAPPVNLSAFESKDTLKNVTFLGKLPEKSNATLGDAYRLAFILSRFRAGDDAGSRMRLTFEGYRAGLVAAGIIDDKASDEADALVTHEQAARLFAKAMRIDGGVFHAISSGCPRYAHREMKAENLFPDVNPRQYIGGPQLHAAYSDCLKYMAG